MTPLPAVSPVQGKTPLSSRGVFPHAIFPFANFYPTFDPLFSLFNRLILTVIRVRFAPSPTGPLHIGGFRTALFNYLFARRNGGSFILRIEDTDRSRWVSSAEDYIRGALEWCQIMPDESVWHGGNCGPYRQSERKDIYKTYVQQLIDNGNAYYAFDTEDELNAMRERLRAARIAAPQYNSIARQEMKNSLTLPKEEVGERIASGDPYVVRLKVVPKQEIRFQDLVRGWVMVRSETIDDKILLKSDGMPTYHLANVVDDHLMKISHVIRGEEWLPSVPTHVLIYRAFGWSLPSFAHLPLLLNPNGKGKLSKRDGDRLGFSVFPTTWQEPASGNRFEGYREQGYLPEAFVNYLALLGWNAGDHREVFSLNDLENEFSIERVGKSGIKFDLAKAQWLNQQHIKQIPTESLVTELKAQVTREIKQADFSNLDLTAICELVRERLHFVKDLWQLSRLFFIAPETYDKSFRKLCNTEVQAVLQEFCQAIDQINWEKETLRSHYKALITERQVALGKAMKALRIALTGVPAGADLMTTAVLLGKQETQQRIQKALATLTAKDLPKMA